MSSSVAASNRVGPADVGRRVTVRRLDEDGSMRDAVGILEAYDDGQVRVVRRTGAVVTFPAARIVAAKVVAPEVGAEALQAVLQSAARPDEVASIGDWQLRHSRHDLRRANSVRVTGDPGVPLPDALRAIASWYGERGCTPVLQVPVPSRWMPGLAAHGWVAGLTCDVLVCDPAVAERLPGRASGVGDWDVRWHDEPPPDWESLTGQPPLPGAGDQRFIVLADPVTSSRVGWARTVRAGGWSLLTTLGVAEASRRKGVARRMLDAVIEEAGADRVRVATQMLETNESARNLYSSNGFEVHHRYAYVSPEVKPFPEVKPSPDLKAGTGASEVSP